jgi:hypothetical protein
MRTHCTFCGATLDADAPGTYQWVSGWERRRKQGGTNALRLAERQGKWACPACIDERVNVGAHQSGLF